MKFFKFITLSFGVLILQIAQLGTAEEEYEAGIDYKVLDNTEEEVTEKTSSEESEKISVVEYFSYGCPACYKIESHISSWIKTVETDVEFKREAVVFFEHWAPLAKAYYAAIELDVLDSIHLPMFEALHDEKLPMQDTSRIKQLFEKEANIDSNAFSEAFDDREAVVDRILEVHKAVRLMKVSSTPTIVVDGRFLVTTRTAQSQKRIFPIVDYLVKKIRDERKSAN